MAQLILIRGLPGSGKSTLACQINNGLSLVCSADDFFIDGNGRYVFEPTRLPEAHARCLKMVRHRLAYADVVSVANNFSTRWELEPYLQTAKEFDVRVTVVDLFDGGFTDAELAARNSHNVPAGAIAKIRQRWEHDWRNGDPRPPRERT